MDTKHLQRDYSVHEYTQLALHYTNRPLFLGILLSSQPHVRENSPNRPCSLNRPVPLSSVAVFCGVRILSTSDFRTPAIHSSLLQAGQNSITRTPPQSSGSLSISNTASATPTWLLSVFSETHLLLSANLQQNRQSKVQLLPLERPKASLVAQVHRDD